MVIKLNTEEIKSIRYKIYVDFKESTGLNDNNIISVRPTHLKILFELYNKNFLSNYFSEDFIRNMTFSFSTKMTKAAGKTIYKRISSNESFEIKLSLNFLKNYNKTNREKIVSGITTKDVVEAMMIILEHEICHLIEFYKYKTSSCKTEKFKILSRNLFGHSDIYHKLPTNSEIFMEKFHIELGNKVVFKYKGVLLQGTLYKINKNAVVMVNDDKGAYCDKFNNRYSKYYVPLEQIKKINFKGGDVVD
ncbi:MAG: hypothetical protein KID00_09135 [Clostridium argentinense]|uniref:hypothetical protein n=1 Tax=Clostridium butanoliproducens TaxID=2991837 RepID=UPI001E081481|nr:hypothetical protein [Clostridium butanoliproducens]MBS5824009.1 hypothetical protein [Clostridium argentinense]MDU1348669.1 hypothetical protein [Clostridium argentinense]